MNLILKNVLLTTACFLTSAALCQGNKVGAMELLVNPYSNSAAWAGANVAGVEGLNAVHLNIAGLTSVNGTELTFDRITGLGSFGIRSNNLGFAQKIGEKNTIAVTGMTTSSRNEETVNPIGQSLITTSHYSNLNIGFARQFSNSVSTGINVKYISQTAFNIRGSGIAFDAGVQYVAGKNNQFKIGATVKNIGPDLRFGEKGSFFVLGNTPDSLQGLAAEMPALFSVGGSYEFKMQRRREVTVAAATSLTPFYKNQFKLGFHYKKKLEIMHLNAMVGYVYENLSLDFYTHGSIPNLNGTGLTAGFSINIVDSNDQNKLGLHYAYRQTRLFAGMHSFGLKFQLE
ncbi:MAG: hypothetical protein GQ574_06230 [Crocinitomix sp.]|nr:hypothetical protein [Crocinitomix sp.]